MAQGTNEQKQRNRIAILVLVLVLAVAGGAIAYLSTPPKVSPGSNSGLRQAPDFALKDAQGVVHRLSDFKGTPVIVHFWASWCPPCLSEIPEWVELARRFQGKKVKFVAISLDRKWADALKVLPQNALPRDVLSLLDESGKVPDRFGTFQFPETYLINAEGRIVMKWVGGQNWRASEVQRLIEREAAR